MIGDFVRELSESLQTHKQTSIQTDKRSDIFTKNVKM